MAMISSPNIVGPRTSTGRVADHVELGLHRGGEAQPADAVFDHDHGAVDDEPEVDRPRAHQAGGDARGPHQVGGEEHRERDGEPTR